MLPALNRVLAFAAILGAATALASSAGADVGTCLKSAEHAQPLRAQGRLVEARSELIVCGAATCPAAVRKDCAGWLADVEEALPSVILEARDAGGQDLVDVAVFIDDVKVRTSLDGSALAIDPGARRVRFEAPDRLPVEQTVLLRQGERRRVIAVTLSTAGERVPAASTFAPPAPSGAATVRAESRPGVPVASWVLGGVGVALAGAGLSLWLVGRAEHGELEQTCADAGTCAHGDIVASRTKLIAGDLLMGAGVLALGAGVIIALSTGPRRAAISLSPRGVVAVAKF